MPAEKFEFYNYNNNNLESTPNNYTYSYDDGGGPTMNERLAKLETRFDAMQTNIQDVKSEIRNTKVEMQAIRSDLHSVNRWAIGVAITSTVAIAAVIVGFGAYQASWIQRDLDVHWQHLNETISRIESASKDNIKKIQNNEIHIRAIELKQQTEKNK